jgi:hypothetical protein
MEGKTEEEVQRYAKVFKERYKELSGKSLSQFIRHDFFFAKEIYNSNQREFILITSTTDDIWTRAIPDVYATNLHPNEQVCG